LYSTLDRVCNGYGLLDRLASFDFSSYVLAKRLG